MTVTNSVVFELENVDLYRQKPILTNINWRVEKGQHWVIIGRNGAGKTKLLEIISGYIWPSRGRVRVLGSQFGKIDLRILRRRMGWVSSALREKIPRSSTALKVVLSGQYASFGLYEQPSDEMNQRAESLLKTIDIGGLNHVRFDHLSQGEQQRVMLARSLMSRPELLILDEPCAGLDFTASVKFLNLVTELAKDKTGPTLLMVTHRVDEIVPGLTHALLLHNGNILKAGELNQVITDDLISQALEMKINVFHNNGHWRAERD